MGAEPIINDPGTIINNLAVVINDLTCVKIQMTEFSFEQWLRNDFKILCIQINIMTECN